MVAIRLNIDSFLYLLDTLKLQDAMVMKELYIIQDNLFYETKSKETQQHHRPPPAAAP